MTSQQPGPLPVSSNKSKGSLSRSWTTLLILPRAILNYVLSMSRVRILCQDQASQSFKSEYESIFL